MTMMALPIHQQGPRNPQLPPKLEVHRRLTLPAPAGFHQPPPAHLQLLGSCRPEEAAASSFPLLHLELLLAAAADSLTAAAVRSAGSNPRGSHACSRRSVSRSSGGSSTAVVLAPCHLNLQEVRIAEPNEAVLEVAPVDAAFVEVVHRAVALGGAGKAKGTRGVLLLRLPATMPEKGCQRVFCTAHLMPGRFAEVINDACG